jgi:uncharacterized protein YndB with AHSA1/START domain
MTLTAHPLEKTVERTILILAPRDTVFRYFTDPGRFAAWWGAGSTIEGRVGGRLQIRYPNGETASGEVLEIVPDEFIAFSYGYDSPGKPISPGGSRVTVALQSRRGGTLVTLRHEVSDTKTRDAHVAGWRHQMAVFSTVVAAEQHAGLAGTLDRWFGAWNARTPEERSAALDASVADDVEFRDAFGALFSREEVAAHLALVPIHMPGMTWKRAGEPRQCQGSGLVDWVAEGPDGAARARGTNVFTLAPDGRLARVTGLRTAP